MNELIDRRESLKVLHLIDGLGSGGAERLLFTNLQHLPDQGVESDVVTVFGNDNFWRDSIRSLGVEVHSLNCSGNAEIIAGMSRLRKHLAAIRPNLIHTHLFTSNVIGRIAGRLAGIPVISSIHNPEYEPEAVADVSSSIRKKIAVARRVDKITARFGCSQMIAVSEYVKHSIVTRLGFPSEKIEVIYNPVGEPNDQHRAGREEALMSLGLPADSILLLHVGRLSPQKGFIDAVRAMPEILRSFPTAKLISVGAHVNREYETEVNAEVSSRCISASVILAGERRDVADLVRVCDVFVFPSHFEGLGIALAEAMAAGSACVVTDMPPLTEFVEHDVSGMLVSKSDSASFAREVIKLIGDPDKRKTLGSTARATAKNLFDARTAAEKLTTVYTKTARHGGQ